MDLLRSPATTDYWTELRRDLVEKRNRMARILTKAQMKPIVPQGGYFMLADFSPLANQFKQYKEEGRVDGKVNTNDYMFVRWLSRTQKLQGIPGSAFYSPANKHLAQNLVRFCFIKQSATLDKLEALIDKLTTVADGGNNSTGSQTGAGLERSKL